MKRLAQFVLASACCLVALGCTRDFKPNDALFDTDKWKARDLRARGQMTNDLQGRKIIDGKLPQEVRSILGDPDNIDRTGSFVYQTDPGAWEAGANNGPWIHYLHVEFGKDDGRVIKVYITD